MPIPITTAQKSIMFARPKAAVYEPEATALFARMTAQPSLPVKTAFNKAIKSLRGRNTAGDPDFWPFLDILWVVCEDAQQSARNWIQDNYNLVPTNSPTFTGLATPATSGWQLGTVGRLLETNFNPSSASSPKYTQNSVWLGGGSRTATTSAGADVYAAFGGRLSYATATMITNFNDGTNDSVGTPTDGQGLFSGVRLNSTTKRGYRNQTIIGSATRASTGVVNASYKFGGVTGAESIRKHVCGWIGGWPGSDANVLAFHAIIATLLSDLGASV